MKGIIYLGGFKKRSRTNLII